MRRIPSTNTIFVVPLNRLLGWRGAVEGQHPGRPRESQRLLFHVSSSAF